VLFRIFVVIFNNLQTTDASKIGVFIHIALTLLEERWLIWQSSPSKEGELPGGGVLSLPFGRAGGFIEPGENKSHGAAERSDSLRRGEVGAVAGLGNRNLPISGRLY
jgi:hypothetical protein